MFREEARHELAAAVDGLFEDRLDVVRARLWFGPSGNSTRPYSSAWRRRRCWRVTRYAPDDENLAAAAAARGRGVVGARRAHTHQLVDSQANPPPLPTPLIISGRGGR